MPASALRQQTHTIIFGHETWGGRAFDIALIAAILASVAVVMLESVSGFRASHGPLLVSLEWLFTIGFTLEYLLRLWSVPRARDYARSFFGVVDLLAVLPTWLSLVLPGGQVLGVIRILRVVRVFRILKLAQYVGEAGILLDALRASRYKITVFLVTVVSATVCVGSVMFLVEGPEHGFANIPTAVYWAIVTLTTVGFGDITPQTPLGQFIASFIMILGYGIIAVPTGIVSAEIAWAARRNAMANVAPTPLEPRPACTHCGRSTHPPDARFCAGCGTSLEG